MIDLFLKIWKAKFYDFAVEILNNAGDPDYSGKIQTIAKRLKDHTGPIYLVAHEDPDGDAIGSLLGLSRALKQLGKDAHAIADCPRYLKFLENDGELLSPVAQLPESALLVSLDCGNWNRVIGAALDQVPVINIDHHGTNSRFGEISLVEPAKSANALIVKDLIDALDVQWNKEIATPVLTGIITDTGSFRYSNTTPEAFYKAAELVGFGAPLALINEEVSIKPRAFFHLQAEFLSNLEFHLNDKVAFGFVNQQIIERTGASWEEVESLIGTIRYAEGICLAIIIKDKGDPIKVSLRSRGGVSAQNIAVACGGGGHFAAAGATMTGNFDQAKAQVLSAAKDELVRLGLL